MEPESSVEDIIGHVPEHINKYIPVQKEKYYILYNTYKKNGYLEIDCYTYIQRVTCPWQENRYI